MNKYLLFFILIVLSISGILLAEDFKEGTKLSEGKNVVNFGTNFEPFYVKDLINAYPQIETVTYNSTDREIGYVNAFGGIGENFIIYPNKTYELTTKREIILNLK